MLELIPEFLLVCGFLRILVRSLRDLYLQRAPYKQVLPVEIPRLPLLEKLYQDGNRLTTLPSELGELENLKVLTADYNMLVCVPAELRQCIEFVELSPEHNKLVRPLLDFRKVYLVGQRGLAQAVCTAKELREILESSTTRTLPEDYLTRHG